jgi:hypothetical protein
MMFPVVEHCWNVLPYVETRFLEPSIFHVVVHTIGQGSGSGGSYALAAVKRQQLKVGRRGCRRMCPWEIMGKWWQKNKKHSDKKNKKHRDCSYRWFMIAKLVKQCHKPPKIDGWYYKLVDTNHLMMVILGCILMLDMFGDEQRWGDLYQAIF